MRMKVIQTKYKGYKFRSRLEARWAVYFDSLEIEWEYEFEGYNLDGTYYLPDFWLPALNMWAEVKPVEFNDQEIKKIKKLILATNKPVLMLVGVPKRKTYFSMDATESNEKFFKMELILSNYHGYPEDEGRFYSMPGYDKEIFEYWFDDIDFHVKKSKQARFEFKEGRKNE